MNLYYAMGGGLGHLTRARAFLEQFGLENNTSILAFSEFAKDKRVVGKIDVIETTKKKFDKEEHYQNFLRDLFAKHSFETVYLDTFPYGIKREFSNFNFGNAQIKYIARLMDWSNYINFRPIQQTIRFEKTYILEDLEPEHSDYIFQNSKTAFPLKLKYPEPKLNDEDQQKFEEIKNKKNFWLVVHSHGADEIFDLICTADAQRIIEERDIEIVIITPMDYQTTVTNCSTYNIYPATVLFPYAERIFTASGFNIMQQTAEFRHKHQFTPYSRTFDRQHERAKRFREPQSK